jgi:hypothetical protein
MNWVKLGQVFVPPGDLPWARTHAAIPFVETVGDLCRVYFSARDERNRSHLGSFLIDVNAPGRILAVSEQPALGPGLLGSFDDNGVSATSMVAHDGRDYLYYAGWALGVTVPFYLNVGLAVRDRGEATFRRLSPAPLFDRNAVDPYLTCAPFVLRDEGRWRMWYTSATEWRRRGDVLQHRYRIKYAESRDGVIWNRTGQVCIDFDSDEEYAIGRPCVVNDGDRYRMWYCYRGDRYRIGYAESGDGVAWNRRDALGGLDVSAIGWDSEMVAYPYVFDHHGQRYMFYNGNDYGRTGIGLAMLR